MSVKRGKKFKFFNAATLFSMAAAVCIVGVYITFDFYLSSVGRELINSWLQSEAVAIQEGNLLTSITKNQRILLSSQFVKGVALFDTSASPPLRLIEVGIPIQPPTVDARVSAEKIRVVATGFFQKQAVYVVPNRSDLVLIFAVESTFLQRLFFFTVVALLLFIIVLFGGIKIVQRREFAIENEAKIQLGELAAQVAHDISGPASVIQQILGLSSGRKIHGFDEIQSELDQMKSLAQKLLRQYRGDLTPEQADIFSLSKLLSFVAKEARALAGENCGIVTDFPTGDVSVRGVRYELSSALSNIIRNAIEAIGTSSGVISVKLRQFGNSAEILISDNGCGIPAKVIHSVFEQGVSFKRGGTGIGLYQARSVIEAMGGEIVLSSTPGEGTLVQIMLPISALNRSFEIEVAADTQLVFLDNDTLIHQFWKEILPPDLARERLHFLARGDELRAWVLKNNRVTAIYFVDYELSRDSNETGVDILIDLELCDSAFLVTGRATECSRMETVQANGLRVIDKIDLGKIQFKILSSEKTKLVLIDDSRACRMAWIGKAEQINVGIECFASADDFFNVASRIERTVPIYVDYFFEGEPTGPAAAARLISAGFENVFLTTTYAKEKVLTPEGLRGIVGKDFPSVT